MFLKYLLPCLLLLGINLPVLKSQHLKPGFDKQEYIELLKISAAFGDSTYVASFPKPAQYKFVYRSPVVGLDNRWDLWVSEQKAAVISLRGTVGSSASWMANFYAAMVPATGELTLSRTEKFVYQLADNPRAAVHVGWLLSTAFLSKDILPKIDSCYKAGIKDIIILGHSQGGAISYLLTSYVYQLQKTGALPADIRFKTYGSAASKPGNLYYAYDFEALTQNGWAFNVVNTADWVPEVPFSVQTVNDFNKSNPFTNVKKLLKKQKFPANIVLPYAYNRMDKPSRRAQRNYQKYLGKMISKMVRKTVPEFEPPAYYPSNDYVRTGRTIVLAGDSTYRKLYADDGKNIFVHHLHPPYLYLAEKLDLSPDKNEGQTQPAELTGTWELTFLSGRRIAFEGLFPEKKPTISFDIAQNRITGNTSCNSFTGKLNRSGNKINFMEPLAMTKMFCPGEGEQAFVETLKTITAYSFNAQNELIFLAGDVPVMRFKKQ